MIDWHCALVKGMPSQNKDTMTNKISQTIPQGPTMLKQSLRYRQDSQSKAAYSVQINPLTLNDDVSSFFVRTPANWPKYHLCIYSFTACSR